MNKLSNSASTLEISRMEKSRRKLTEKLIPTIKEKGRRKKEKKKMI